MLVNPFARPASYIVSTQSQSITFHLRIESGALSRITTYIVSGVDIYTQTVFF